MFIAFSLAGLYVVWLAGSMILTLHTYQLTTYLSHNIPDMENKKLERH